MALWLITLLACGRGEPCANEAPGLEQDACLHDQVLATPAAQLDVALVLLGRINDPVIRSAAIFTWVSTNNRELTPERGMSMCRLLEGRERNTCERKLQSVHLRR